jgi:cytochrome c oxidase subunit 1
MSTEITHDTAHDEHDHHGPAKGLMRWVTTTNHKDIGTLYLWLSFIMLLYGGGMAMIIRLDSVRSCRHSLAWRTGWCR